MHFWGKARNGIFDPRASGRPARAAAAAGLATGLTTAIAIATTGYWAAAAAGGLAAGLAVALPYRYLAAGQAAAIQETRDLWGLGGVILDGRPWPSPGGWALGAGALALLLREIRLRELRTVVELGPGASSVILGRTLPHLEITGFEHDERFHAVVRDSLKEHDLDRYQLIHAPLHPVESEGRTVTWYDPKASAELPPQIDVLIVDGPPNGAGAGNRSPAWQMLRDRMRAGGIVLVDDTDRADERAMAKAWAGDGLRVIADHGEFIMLEVV